MFCWAAFEIPSSRPVGLLPISGSSLLPNAFTFVPLAFVLSTRQGSLCYLVESLLLPRQHCDTRTRFQEQKWDSHACGNLGMNRVHKVVLKVFMYLEFIASVSQVGNGVNQTVTKTQHFVQWLFEFFISPL